MFKKLVTITLCVVLIFSISVPVFATSDSDMTFREYMDSYSYLTVKLFKGDLSYSDYLVQKTAVDSEYLKSVNNSVGGAFTNISEVVSDDMINLSNSIEDFWENMPEENINFYSGVLDDFFEDYEVLSDKTTVNIDLQGYSCAVKQYSFDPSDTSKLGSYCMYYCTDGVISSDGKSISAYVEREVLYVDNELAYDVIRGNNYGLAFDISNKTILYGTWLRDGEEDTEISIPAETTEQEPDFSGLSDEELQQFLNDFLSLLKNLNPDLSGIEGILESIYYKLGTLDSDNDGERLQAIESAIYQLSAVVSAESEKIVAVLENNKDSSAEDFKTILEELIGMNGNYSEISRFEIVKMAFNDKFSFISDIRSLCDSTLNAYRNTSGTPVIPVSFNGQSYSIDFSMFNDYMPSFRIMIAVFIYISYAFRTYRKIPSYIDGGGDDK